MATFDFETDEATRKIFEVTAWCLVRYFHVADADASTLINEYRQKYLKWRDDDAYHHDGPYENAARIFYALVLKGDLGTYVDWRTKHGHNCPPRDYFVYYRNQEQ